MKAREARRDSLRGCRHCRRGGVVPRNDAPRAGRARRLGKEGCIAQLGGRIPHIDEPAPAPHMTWTQMDGCSCLFRTVASNVGFSRRTDYRPNMGVTSSMLLGLEYAAGLRDGSGRSTLDP